MLGAVEAHVLQKVGKPALVVFFQNGAYLLRDIEVRLVLGQSVVPDVVGQSVR